ncbi:glycosyltransferase family protein [Hoeflea sp.]|uniref:glycosyltransferase family protein n=1 Tax=Hoeflea sp. TaxID=1940281 RepID=UPI00374842FC
MTGQSVLFYVQHLLGIGHLARASRISQALVQDGYDVTMVTGGLPVKGFPPATVRHVALPPVVSADAGFSGLADMHGNPVDEAFKDQRRAKLLDTLATLKPDIVLIEAFPFGRRQMRFELLPFLKAIHATKPRPRVYSSVRDILQARAKPGRDEESVALLNTWFDGVLVHGHPDFVRLDETFPLAGAIQDKIIYTGLVAAPKTQAGKTDIFDIVVSAGGGAVGANLVEAATGAAQRLPQSLRWCLIAGPNMPQLDYDRIVQSLGSNVELHRFREDFRDLLKAAELSVSQAGYNTVGDVLEAGCRSVVVPFTSGGETEQQVRADRLVLRGLARSIHETDLDADRLADEITHALALSKPKGHGIDLGGASRTAAILGPGGLVDQL